VFTFLANVVGIPTEFTLLLGGLGLIVTAILNPDGQAGRVSAEYAKLRRRFERPSDRVSSAAVERVPDVVVPS
jgi:branched-chain amino acid transport system permease protein